MADEQQEDTAVAPAVDSPVEKEEEEQSSAEVRRRLSGFG
jgi:hypothetical protein